MRWFYIALLIFTLSGCDLIRRDQEPDSGSPIPPPAHLLERGDLYCMLSSDAYLSKGYVHSKCDGSGFTSLYSVRCPNVDLSVFSDDEGKLWRSPTKDCFSSGESEAESSRDMWLMRMVAAWVHKDLAWVEKASQFGEDHEWSICQASSTSVHISRCILSPQLILLLKTMRDRLQGGEQSFRLQEDFDAIALPVHEDYEAHLDVLRIWLSGEVYGALTKAEKDLLEIYADREPKNALFQAVWGVYTDSVIDVWSVLDAWPSDRLPNTADWAEPYLWQRSMMNGDQPNSDWLPVNGPPVDHDGTDFNLALYIAARGVKP